LVIEIVKRSHAATGFVVLPKRWVVERTFGWIRRCRRFAKDWEATVVSPEAWRFRLHLSHDQAIARA
jgi:transposase